MDCNRFSQEEMAAGDVCLMAEGNQGRRKRVFTAGRIFGKILEGTVLIFSNYKERDSWEIHEEKEDGYGAVRMVSVQ